MKDLTVFRFLLVGALSAGAQCFALFIFFNFYEFSSKFSISFSYAISVFVHYLGNKYFTFESITSPNSVEIGRYLSVVLINYVITLFVAWIIVDVFKNNLYLATLFSIATTVWIGFLLNKFWVFKKKEDN